MPVRASSKKNEKFVYNNLIDKRKKIKTKFQVNDLVRTADLKRTFSKGDTTNWSYKYYKTSQNIIDTIPSFEIDNLLERHNELLLKRSNETLKENDSVMNNINLK